MDSIKKDLVETFAWFEFKFPLYWCVITHHMLWECIVTQLELIGAFWALGLLAIEQFHIVIKKMARGSKNFMVSFMNHYELFENVQIEFKLNDEDDTSLESMTGDLVARRPPREQQEVVIALGNQFIHFFMPPVFMPHSCCNCSDFMHVVAVVFVIFCLVRNAFFSV